MCLYLVLCTRSIVAVWFGFWFKKDDHVRWPPRKAPMSACFVWCVYMCNRCAYMDLLVCMNNVYRLISLFFRLHQSGSSWNIKFGLSSRYYPRGISCVSSQIWLLLFFRKSFLWFCQTPLQWVCRPHCVGVPWSNSVLYPDSVMCPIYVIVFFLRYLTILLINMKFYSMCVYKFIYIRNLHWRKTFTIYPI